MNTVHIDTKEAVNKSNFNEIQREAKRRQVLRLANQEKNLESNISRPRPNILLIVRALFAWPAALLHHRVSPTHLPHSVK